MAMDEEMRTSRLNQIASEGQELLDVATFRRDPARARVDNVVKPQLQPLVRIKRA